MQPHKPVVRLEKKGLGFPACFGLTYGGFLVAARPVTPTDKRKPSRANVSLKEAERRCQVAVDFSPKKLALRRASRGRLGNRLLCSPRLAPPPVFRPARLRFNVVVRRKDRCSSLFVRPDDELDWQTVRFELAERCSGNAYNGTYLGGHVELRKQRQIVAQDAQHSGLAEASGHANSPSGASTKIRLKSRRYIKSVCLSILASPI